jgi:hypothetical protein
MMRVSGVAEPYLREHRLQTSRKLSSRAAIALAAAAALLALAGATTAGAAPTLSLSPGFAEGTGPDEGTTLTDTVGVTGAEYDGGPLPLTGLTFRFPKGTGLSNDGFPICARSVLEPSGPGPAGCPLGSLAGPHGSFNGLVSLGGERIKEAGAIEVYFSPEGGLSLYLSGHSPVALEVLVPGHYVAPSGSLGPGMTFELPLVESVPGAPFVSITELMIALGAFRVEGGARVASVTAPPACSTSMGWEVAGTFSDGKLEDTAAHEATTACFAGGKRAEEEAAALRRAEEEAAKAAAKRQAEEAARKREEAFAGAVAALSGSLVPHGKNAKGRALIKNGGYRFSTIVPADTTLIVEWYLVPRGAHLSTRKPVLVAAGSVSVAVTQTTPITVRLTGAGRRLLKTRKTLTLTALGKLEGPNGTTVRKRTFRLVR